MIKIELVFLAVVASALHVTHKQTTLKYNSTNYLQDLQSRQDKFTSDIKLIKQQID